MVAIYIPVGVSSELGKPGTVGICLYMLTKYLQQI